MLTCCCHILVCTRGDKICSRRYDDVNLLPNQILNFNVDLGNGLPGSRHQDQFALMEGELIVLLILCEVGCGCSQALDSLVSQSLLPQLKLGDQFSQYRSLPVPQLRDHLTERKYRTLRNGRLSFRRITCRSTARTPDDFDTVGVAKMIGYH